MTVDDEMTTSWSPIELWLDLRGTRITPRTAVLNLDSPFPVSRVLVSEEQTTQVSEEDPDILYADEENGILCDVKDSSKRYGTILTIDDASLFIDPIPALDTTAKGGWVLVDFTEESDKANDRYEATASLVEFLVGGASLGDKTLSLESIPEDVDSLQFDGRGRGGIAIACQTKEDVVQSANMLQSMDSGSVVTTESGILLKARADPQTEGSSFEAPLQSALVLPFDTPLWKTAALVLTSTEP